MITYVCNKCKKAIENDDIEAIEVEEPVSRMLFPQNEEDKKFRIVSKAYNYYANKVKGYEYLHFCGECKHGFYDYL